MLEVRLIFFFVLKQAMLLPTCDTPLLIAVLCCALLYCILELNLCGYARGASALLSVYYYY
jgi:hypothetical protein